MVFLVERRCEWERVVDGGLGVSLYFVLLGYILDFFFLY